MSRNTAMLCEGVAHDAGRAEELEFVTVLPGHGDALTDKAKVDCFQAYLREVWKEVVIVNDDDVIVVGRSRVRSAAIQAL